MEALKPIHRLSHEEEARGFDIYGDAWIACGARARAIQIMNEQMIDAWLARALDVEPEQT